MCVPSPFLQRGPSIGDRLTVKPPRMVRVPQHADRWATDSVHERDHLFAATEVAVSLNQDLNANSTRVFAQRLQPGGNPVQLLRFVFVRANQVTEDSDELRTQFASEIAIRLTVCQLL